MNNIIFYLYLIPAAICVIGVLYYTWLQFGFNAFVKLFNLKDDIGFFESLFFCFVPLVNIYYALALIWMFICDTFFFLKKL